MNKDAVRQRPIGFLLWSILALAFPLITGCVPQDPIDDAVRAIDEAIETLDRGVTSFEGIQGTLEGVVNNLDEGVYKRQASDLIHDVGQVADLAGAHMIDFTRTRVREDLTNMKRKLLGQPPLPRRPVVTTPSVSEIRFTDPGRGAIRIIGWNLDIANEQSDKYRVEIKTATGSRRVAKQFVHYMGQYAVSVDISSSGTPLLHDDRALSLVGYDGEFSIPITGSEPPSAVAVSGSGKLKTDKSHAEKKREDCEVHSDDWTLVKVKYNIRTSGQKSVEARIVWDVYEANRNKSLGSKTHIQSVKDWHRVWTLPSRYARMVGIERGASGQGEKWYRGEAHGWKSFPNTGGLSNVQVRFDGGGGDCDRQGFTADLAFTVRAIEGS